MSNARDRILDAVIDLYIDGGRKNVTYRAIAKAAEVSNSTIRTLFTNPDSSRDYVDSAIDAALERELRLLDGTVPTPKPEMTLKDALVQLITAYHEFYSQRKFLMYLFADMVRNKEFMTTFLAIQEGTIIRLIDLYSAYERRADWAPSIQGLERESLNAAISIPLLGTVFIGAFWGLAGVGPTADFDADLLVDRFLYGHGADSTDRKIELLKEMIASLEAQR